MQRGSQVGRIKLVYEARKKELPQWLRFESLRTNALFHSDQGWGSFLDLGIGNRTIRFTPIVAIDNADDLVEEYPAPDCDSRRGSWALAGLASASNGPGSIRIGVPKRWPRSRSTPKFQEPMTHD